MNSHDECGWITTVLKGGVLLRLAVIILRLATYINVTSITIGVSDSMREWHVICLEYGDIDSGVLKYSKITLYSYLQRWYERWLMSVELSVIINTLIKIFILNIFSSSGYLLELYYIYVYIYLYNIDYKNKCVK